MIRRLGLAVLLSSSVALVAPRLSFAQSARQDRKFGIMLQCFFDSLGLHAGYHWTSRLRTSIGSANSNKDSLERRSKVYVLETRFFPIDWTLTPFVGLAALYNAGPAYLRDKVSPGVHPIVTTGADVVFDMGLYLAYTQYFALKGNAGAALHIGYFFSSK